MAFFKIKKQTFWALHSFLGLLVGIPMLIVAVTGSVLVFKDEINALLMPEQVVAEPTPTGRLSYDQLYQRVNEQIPGYLAVGWAIYDDPTQMDFLYFMKVGESEWLHTYLNPYTGKLSSQPRALDSDLMGWTVELHDKLLAGHLGTLVVGIIAILLFVLGLSGFLLYRGFWKNLFRMQFRRSLRQVSGNLHKRIGVISAPVFLILGFTGGWWNLSHIAYDGIFEHEDPGVEKIYLSESISLENLVQQAEEKISGYTTHYFAFPRESGNPLTLYGAVQGQSTLRSPYGSMVSFDAQSGEMLSSSRIQEGTYFSQFLDSFRPLHYGNFGGIVTRLIWCVLGIAPGILAVSGYLVWWKRTSVKRKKKSSAVVGRFAGLKPSIPSRVIRE